jgi:D-ribose pyranase
MFIGCEICMKRTALLNQPLSTVIAGLGHLDMLCLADAGLPIPPETQRIDLAVSAGLPAFQDVLKVTLSEMKVERAIVAAEIVDCNPRVYASLRELLGDVPIDLVPHTEFKTRTRSARAVVRTGEFSPYANVILVAGVVF